VLAGDHVYKMDYARMLVDHAARKADMTIACIQVPVQDATASASCRSTRPAASSASRKAGGAASDAGTHRRRVGEHGIYVFNASFLYEQLIRDADLRASRTTSGKDIIPHLIERGYRVMAHDFAESCVNMIGDQPYWRDVGTIDAFWRRTSTSRT